MVIKGQSYKHIAWHFNELNVPTTTGKLWYPITVSNLLQKPKYKGVRVHKGVEHPGQWAPVFDLETWEELQLAIQLRSATKAGVPKPRRYMLTGVLFCGGCGVPLNGMTKRDNPSRPLRRTYQCRVQGDAVRKHGCGGVTRNADALEHWIRECVFAHINSAEVLELVGVNKEDTEAIKSVLADRKQQQAMLDQFVDDYATGLLTRPQFERAKLTAESELKRLEKLLTRYASSNAVLSMLPSDKSVEEAWHEESDDWKRSLVSSLVERIIVNPGITKPFYYVDGKVARFDPSLVVIEWRSFQ